MTENNDTTIFGGPRPSSTAVSRDRVEAGPRTCSKCYREPPGVWSRCGHQAMHCTACNESVGVVRCARCLVNAYFPCAEAALKHGPPLTQTG